MECCLDSQVDTQKDVLNDLASNNEKGIENDGSPCGIPA